MSKEKYSYVGLLGMPVERFALEPIKQINPFRTYTYIVYRITNIVEHKVYIGITKKTFNRRYSGGRWWDCTRNEYLKKDYCRLGKEAFTVEIVDSGYNADDLIKIESLLIETHRSLYPNGYNKRARSSTISEDTRQKLSISTKKYRTGRKCSEATKEKMRRSARRGIDHPFYGRRGWTDEIEKKRKEACVKKNSKAVIQINFKTQQIIAEFESMKKASIDIGIDVNSITLSCKSSTYRAKGFVWRYKNGSSPPFDYLNSPSKSKPILQIDPTTGQIINEYISIASASIHTGIFASNIAAVCRKIRRTSGGFIWKFKI